MTLTVPALLALLVIAAVCGAIGKALAGGTGGGLIGSIALGFIGGLVGPWIAREIGLSEPIMIKVGGQPFPIVWSIIGAALFVGLMHVLSKRN